MIIKDLTKYAQTKYNSSKEGCQIALTSRFLSTSLDRLRISRLASRFARLPQTEVVPKIKTIC